MEVPGLGFESELQLQVYTIAMAILDPCLLCKVCNSLQQCWILNPLSEARDQTHILMDTMSGSLPAEPQREFLKFHILHCSLFCLYVDVLVGSGFCNKDTID